MTRPSPEEIQAFVDGELSAEDADRVATAVASDDALAAELDEALQVRALAHAMTEAPKVEAVEAKLAEAPRAPLNDLARARAKRKRLVGIALAAPLMAAGLAAYCVAKGPRAPDGPADPRVGELVASALAPARSLLPRLSWEAVDRHRPYDTARAGGAGREALSFELLAKVEALGEPRALAAANALIGNVEQAGQVLERAGSTPEVWSDRAALALMQGNAESALRAADRAVAKPTGPALWNRALAFEALGLDRTAVALLEQVAAMGEAGWADEAKRRAQELAGQRARREAAHRTAQVALAAMATGGPPALDQVDVAPGLARLYLYDAVRAAPSAERVRALEPIAVTLDGKHGGDVLVRLVRRIAAGPFGRRAKLAPRYAELVAGRLADPAALLGELRAAGREAEDLLLGALILASPTRQVAKEHLGEYVRLAEATGDPWFEMLAAEQRAYNALGEDVARAEAVLRAATARCGEPGAIAFRCQRLTRLQVQVYIVMHRAAAAQAAWTRSRKAAAGMPAQEDELLWFAGLIATVRDNTSGRLHGLTQAYFEEWGRTGVPCARIHDARLVVAQSLINQNRLDEARAHLAAPAACDPPPGTRRAFILGQLLRSGDTTAAAALQREIDALRAGGGFTAAEHTVIDHVEGRALLTLEPARGRAHLRGITERRLITDPLVIRARSYSFAVLVQDAGQRAAWADALELLAAERGARPPERCTLGASLETAATFVARDDTGALAGAHLPLAAGQVEAPVPPELRRHLARCSVVDIFARPPYYGRPDLLPGLAVRFRASASPTTPAPGPTLLVGNVTPPPELQLAPLQPIALSPDVSLLEGAEATPDRVLAAMRTASFVEIHSHGLVGIALDDAALLVLSPDPTGRYALTATDVARTRLEARPIIVLAACDAAVVGSSFHATWGLADAFIAAGASAVIASPSPIRDASAPRFFAAVRARIQRGADPAAALHAERATYADPAQRAPLDQLVVFQ